MHKHERCRITLQPAVQKSLIFVLVSVLLLALVLELVLVLLLVLLLKLVLVAILSMVLLLVQVLVLMINMKGAHIYSIAVPLFTNPNYSETSKLV